MAFMSSLCDCLRYAFGPVPDQCDCAEERRADAWHAYQAYRLRHLGRTGRLGFRKLAATSAQLAPLELPLLRQSVVEVALTANRTLGTVFIQPLRELTEQELLPTYQLPTELG